MQEFYLDGWNLFFKSLGLDELTQGDSVYGGLCIDPRTLQYSGERKSGNKQETNQESEFSHSRYWQEEPVVTAARLAQGRDTGLRRPQCRPPASFEKSPWGEDRGTVSSHKGSGGVLQERNHPVSLGLNQYSVRFWTQSRVSCITVCLSPVGEMPLEVTELWHVLCRLALTMVLWDEQSGC